MRTLTCKACLLGLLLPLLAQGQEAGLLRMNPKNAESGSEAAVWGGVEQGYFRPSYQGTFVWKAGAEAKTIRHGEKTSWTGGISFQQMMGQNMGSSMLLEPGYFPMDVVEVAEGTKSRQTGKLEAAFLTDFGREWAGGLKASAQVDYQAKQREIKHSTMGLEALLEPTLTYVMDDDIGLVSAYHVRVRMEQLKIAQEDGALPFVDQGLRIGGFESGLGQFPILELAHGFNELLYFPEFSAEFGISWKRGRAGNPNYNRFNFPGSTLHAAFGQTFEADKADHVYRIAYLRDRDQLRDPGDSGSDGFTALSGRKRVNLEVKYEAKFLYGTVKRIGVDLGGNQWDEHALWLDPADAALWYDGTATLLSSFSFGPVDLDLDVFGGRGWWKERGRLADTPEDSPRRMMTDWYKNMDFRTAPRVGVNGSMTVHISGVKGLFAQLYGNWIHATKVVCIGGQNRGVVTLKLGYKF